MLLLLLHILSKGLWQLGLILHLIATFLEMQLMQTKDIEVFALVLSNRVIVLVCIAQLPFLILIFGID